MALALSTYFTQAMNSRGILIAAVLSFAIGLLLLSAGCAKSPADTPIPDTAERPPAEYAQTLVQEAIDQYNSDGLETTLDYYNSNESMDGEWHVFILDEEGYIIALAAFPSWVGVHDSEFKGRNDYPVGQMVIDSATEEGVQIDYLFDESFGIGLRHVWAVKHEGLIFGSSPWSGGPRPKSDQPLYTQEYIRQAIGLYKASGLDAAVAYYNNPESVDDQSYGFIVDETGDVIAHGANQDLVGMAVVDVKGENGYPSGRIVADDADEDGEWSVYTFFNPATDRSQTKHSWLIRHEGLIFGSGWYEDGPPKSDEPAYTQALVQQALNLYGSSGLDAALDYYSDPVSVDGPWYVFIVDTETGRTIGHFNPELRDRDPALRVDPTGYFYGDDLLGATEEGGWIEYVIRNPDSGEDSLKHTWALRHDGYIFASGWYE